jgi:hypothetical protein
VNSCAGRERIVIRLATVPWHKTAIFLTKQLTALDPLSHQMVVLQATRYVKAVKYHRLVVNHTQPFNSVLFMHIFQIFYNHLNNCRD